MNTPQNEKKFDFSKFKERFLWFVNNKYFAGFLVILGGLAAIAEVSGYSIRDIFSTEEKLKGTKSLTINVHGIKGKNDLILRRKGQVEISYGTKKDIEDINAKGQAIFNEIPAWVFNEDAKILIDVRNTDGEPFRSTNPDSLYRLTVGEPIYLQVELEGLNKVFGTVISEDYPLEGVIVSINELKDTSDELGNYEIFIPTEKHKQTQEVKYYKPGYKMKIKNAFPQT